MRKVVFACVHNAGRSQMAAGWFNRLADLGKVRAISAGTQPAEEIHPQVVRAMSEVGIELPCLPQRVTPELVRDAVVMITMGCGDACPVPPPGCVKLDWPLEDPADKPIERVREIRDEIRGRVEALIRERGWEMPA